MGMTDSRKPRTLNRPTRYPRQIVFMATEDQYAAVKAEAERESETSGKRVSMGVVARRYFDAGRAVTDAAEAAAAGQPERGYLAG